MRKKTFTQERRHPIRNFILGTAALGMAVCFVVGGVFLLWASTLTLPTIEAIEAQRHGQSTKIYDRTGDVLLYDMHQDVRRTEIPLTEMADSVKHATIAIEDEGFYGHHGIEPLAIVRAVVRNLQDGDLFGGQGGSTLTQQVVKNLLLTRDKTITRKLKEWVLAIKMEQKYTKDEILEMYLNEAPYGGTKYGVEEASQAFFGKKASELTLTESAYLASLPQAPTYYSPYGTNRDALEVRKNTVLRAMYEQEYITQDEYDAARAEEIAFRPQSGTGIKAPHFVFYVIEQLSKQYGDAELAQANLQVRTTLDWELQREGERIVFEHATSNTSRFNASNGSLMAVDPNTGDILVMVGSRDYFDEEVDGNFNIGLAMRQPGSAFKPFAYAAAIEKGYTSETVVFDAHTQFSTGCGKTTLRTGDGCYAPNNYDNTFHGPMTFREALAQSVNVPAVKAVYLAGIDSTIKLARRMGVTSLENDRDYGLTLVLGGGEVSLLDMTSAYGTFAHDGYRYPHNAIIDIRDGDGKLVYERTPDGEQIIAPEVARSITDMLADNVARTPAFGANSYLHFPERAVAAKTGTTNDYRDAWIIGYTPTIAVGAWAGNNDNTPMEKKVAGFIVAPMWNEFLTKYFELYPDEHEFSPPPTIPNDAKPVLRGFKPGTTLTLSNASSSTSTPEYSTPTFAHSILHYVNKDDPRGPTPNNPKIDPQYEYWEYGVLYWYLKNGPDQFEASAGVTQESDEIIRPEILITNPDEGETVRADERVRVRFSVESERGVAKIDFYINGEFIGANENEDDRFVFTPEDHNIDEGDHRLLVVVEDEEGTRGGASVDFIVE